MSNPVLFTMACIKFGCGYVKFAVDWMRAVDLRVGGVVGWEGSKNSLIPQKIDMESSNISFSAAKAAL